MVDVRFSYHGVRLRQLHHITKSTMAQKNTHFKSAMTQDEITLTVKVVDVLWSEVRFSVDVASHIDMSNFLSSTTVTNKDSKL